MRGTHSSGASSFAGREGGLDGLLCAITARSPRCPPACGLCVGRSGEVLSSQKFYRNPLKTKHLRLTLSLGRLRMRTHSTSARALFSRCRTAAIMGARSAPSRWPEEPVSILRCLLWWLVRVIWSDKASTRLYSLGSTSVRFGKGKGDRTAGKDNLLALLQALEAVEGRVRYRISSVEPNLLQDEIIAFVAQSNKFVPHFHVPLQSGDDEILGKMRRRYRTDLYAQRVQRISDAMPDACVGGRCDCGLSGRVSGALSSHAPLSASAAYFLSACVPLFAPQKYAGGGHARSGRFC